MRFILDKLRIDFDPVEEAEKCGFELFDLSGRDALRLYDCRII